MSSPVIRNRPARHLAAVAALLALTLLMPWAPAEANSPEEARIAETRAQLDAVREELDAARETAEDDQLSLDEANRQVTAALDAVETAQQAVARQEEAVDDAERDLVTAQTELVIQQDRMGERIGRLYRQQRPDPLLTVISAGNLTDAVRQSSYITAIGRQDRSLVEALGNAQAEVEGRTVALETEQVALAGVLVEQQELLADVEVIRNDRDVIASASQELVAQLQSRESHLEAEAAELVAVVQAREAAAAAAAAAAAQPSATADASGAAPSQAAPPPPSGGGFSWPAGGSVTSGFGPRWGRNHDGLDIAAGHGAPISASKGGTVILAESYGGYGNLVLIAHGGGFVTAYAHLSSIAVSNGQSVGTGTYLGGMGCTGSCTGTHLHFEIRANGVPVDPMAYL